MKGQKHYHNIYYEPEKATLPKFFFIETISICPSKFITCQQDWREREKREVSNMAGMAKGKERKKEEKATQPIPSAFLLSILVWKKITIRKTCAKINFQNFILKYEWIHQN